MSSPLTAQGVVRDGLYLALRRDRKTLILRTYKGEVTEGCELIVKSIEKHEPFTLDGLPDAIAQAVKSVVMPADSFRDGGDDNPGGND